MTPLEHAAAIARTLDMVASEMGVSLPQPLVVGVGDPVVACAETRVSYSSVDLVPNLQNAWACDVDERAAYAVGISRDCARTFNDDGTEDYARLMEVSVIVDLDVQVLTELFGRMTVGEVPTPEGLAVGWGDRIGSITTSLSGGLAVTTLTMTVGVP